MLHFSVTIYFTCVDLYAFVQFQVFCNSLWASVSL